MPHFVRAGHHCYVPPRVEMTKKLPNTKSCEIGGDKKGGNCSNRIFGKLGEIRSRQGAWHAILVDCKIGLVLSGLGRWPKVCWRPNLVTSQYTHHHSHRKVKRKVTLPLHIIGLFLLLALCFDFVRLTYVKEIMSSS